MATRRRRQFGKIRKLPSGRWQASYVDPGTGLRIKAEATFATKADANLWVSTAAADLARGELIDADGARIKFADYATDWLAGRPRLRPRTVEL